MTIYRCVCPTCTSFIASAREPDRTDPNWEVWNLEWQEACDAFLSSPPCLDGQAHPGDGIENYTRYHAQTDD